jgi:anti-anti-sigma factor
VTSPEFRYDLDDARRLLVAHGDLDELATFELRETLAQATDQLTADLTIDLTDVDFLPSSAIGVLATAQTGARRNGSDITFVAADGSVAQRVLAVCGLDYAETLPDAQS